MYRMFVAVSILLASGASEIGVVDINGGGFMQLTSDGRQASHPAWLPDEQTILFSSNRSGVRQIYSMDRSGASVKLVPTSPNNLDAEWPTVGGP
jgi:Tol biopolymer transport system component